MESSQQYMVKKYVQLDNGYNESCNYIAKEVAKRLFVEGKKPYIVEVTSDSFNLEVKRYRGRIAFLNHFICCVDGKAYDPILGWPVNIEDYCKEIFGKDLKMKVIYKFDCTFQDGDDLYLDLNLVDLYFDKREFFKSDLCIDSVIRGIEAGDDFPSVPVVKINEKTYSLTLDAYLISRSANSRIPELVIDGGHNRAVGHYIANKPLKCKTGNWRPLHPQFRKHVKDMNIEDEFDGELEKRRIFRGFYR